MPPGESFDVISIIGPAILALAVLFAFIIVWRLVSLGRVMIANGMRGSMRVGAVSYTHLRAHETVLDIVCRLLLEKKKKSVSYKKLTLPSSESNMQS